MEVNLSGDHNVKLCITGSKLQNTRNAIPTIATLSSNADTTTTVAAAQATATKVTAAGSTPTLVSSKALKRCLSVPIIHSTLAGGNYGSGAPSTSMTTRSMANSMHNKTKGAVPTIGENHLKYQSDTSSNTNFANTNIHIGIPRSNPSSREVSPAPVFNIFAPRARRYSASCSSASTAAAGAPSTSGAVGGPLCMTPRVSQLRKEERVDMNSREVNHEREVHSALQMSQSWEDLTLVAENWSCKSDEFSNPLQVVLPSGVTGCSSPSPTSNRAGGLRLPYGLSPSPTRRTFATRRSMSPIAMRPSQLGPVKRKFELDDNTLNNWNIYSPPPVKKMFIESRGPSPICQSPSSVCPSPDSGTYDGRITPKLFISKLCTTNTNNSNSGCSSPISASPGSNISALALAVGSGSINGAASALCSTLSSSSSSSYSSSGGSEPMCIGSVTNNIDEGISMSEPIDEKQQIVANSTSIADPMCTDLQDEATLMDDIKSETSSIGGCSSISIESSSCDSGAKAAATFLNRLAVVDDMPAVAPCTFGSKNFYIEKKKGASGAKKFIVNHDNMLPNSISNHIGGECVDSIKGGKSTSTAAHDTRKIGKMNKITSNIANAATSAIDDNKL